MEARIRATYLLGYPLKVDIEGNRRDVLPFMVGKYKVVLIIPRKGAL
jgi:hypothetical protein